MTIILQDKNITLNEKISAIYPYIDEKIIPPNVNERLHKEKAFVLFSSFEKDNTREYREGYTSA